MTPKARPRPRPLPLLRFIPALSPRFASPAHLAPLCDVLDAIGRGEPQQVFVTVPPRHAKTETLKHAVVRLLLANPRLRVGYGSYSGRFAEKRSREIRALYRRAGGTIAKDAGARADWRTGAGDGGVWAAGVDGSWTGEGFECLLVDDPVKDRAHAESAVERERLWEWFTDVAFTRIEPGGSILVVHTRWHPDDLGGRLIRDGWRTIHLPALDAAGNALWPERFPPESLLKIRTQLGDYGWSSLYMGRPYPRGGRVFQDVQLYDLPPARLRLAIGIDVAYSSKTSSDYSVAVLVGVDERTDPVTGESTDVVYVLDLVRKQCPAPDFIRTFQALWASAPGAPARWYTGGTEKGLVDVMREMGLDVDARPASADKFVRAQPLAAAWNAGRVLVPRGAPWADDLVTELVGFTGVGDIHDDQVDALAAAFDCAREPGWVQAMAAFGRGGLRLTA